MRLFTQQRRWLLLAGLAAAFSALVLAGCGGDGNPAGGDGSDGGQLKSVTIGGKVWTAKNLNIKTGNSWCYDGKESNCNKYGRLYDWNTAMTVCPTGWHLPTREEWDQLATTAGGYSTAGSKLKSTSGWSSGGNGTDQFGFSALPGGYRSTGGSFDLVGINGYWWTATEFGGGNAFLRSMGFYFDLVVEGYFDVSSGLSVRCVKD